MGAVAVLGGIWEIVSRTLRCWPGLSDRYARIERVETLLFAEGDLGSVLGATARKPAERLGAWDADALLTELQDLTLEIIEESGQQGAAKPAGPEA